MSGLEVDGVSLRLGDRQVLTDVSLHVPPGRFVGLLGPNGSGKTSLLRCAYRRLRPDAGTVRVDGQDLWTTRPQAVARQVAAMTQDPGTAPETTVLETVLLGRLPHRRGLRAAHDEADLDAAVRALERVGALDLADRQVGRLSGGQRQRVLLARTLAQDGRVVLLDEPTNHLDVAHQLDLVALARRLAHDEGRVVVAALHDLGLAAAHCDALALLHDGHLVAYGDPADVLDPVRVREVFGVDATRVTTPDGHLLLDLRSTRTPHPAKDPA
ncbi:ABC transporter ATP-binding protein [uncultured Nocardioides sp.]|uniref:ABC transporter ATP-binding protein n=1 Tax=uncultured Nocardioides sp. TaxID=198441 RepID=UPI00261DB933|nr:ABC transporter ATP-binding protein [uncultured Nocardioides sp.]